MRLVVEETAPVGQVAEGVDVLAAVVLVKHRLPVHIRVVGGGEKGRVPGQHAGGRSLLRRHVRQWVRLLQGTKPCLSSAVLAREQMY